MFKLSVVRHFFSSDNTQRPTFCLLASFSAQKNIVFRPCMGEVSASWLFRVPGSE